MGKEHPQPRGRGQAFAWRAARITLIYAAGASLWIFVSSPLISHYLQDSAAASQMEVAKGILFVLTTAVLLYLLIHRLLLENPAADVAARPPWTVLTVFLAFSGLIGVGGYALYTHQVTHRLEQARHELRSILELKRKLVLLWLREHHAHVDNMRANTLLADAVEHWQAGGQRNGKLGSLVESRLVAFQRAYDLADVCIMGLDGRRLLPHPSANTHPPEREAALARESAAQRTPIVTDLVPSSRHAGGMELGLFIPLANQAGKAIAVLHLRVDPTRELYGTLLTWPLPSSSGETLLLRRDGTRIQLLSPPRQLPGAAPLSFLPDTGVFKAILDMPPGQIATLEGRDYRGEEVLATGEDIPGTDWHIVAKMDRHEILEDTREWAAYFFLLVTALTVAAATTTSLWWHRRQTETEQARRDAELRNRLLTERMDFLSRHANDAILLIDAQGHVLDANERALAMYGYSRDELQERDVRALRATGAAAEFEGEWGQVLGSSGVIYETRHRRRDGSEFPVEVSARLMDTPQGALVQAIIRDITGRKEEEARLARMNAELEQRVQEELARSREKDHQLIQQSRSAAMGEVVHHIAHHWRQPLAALGMLLENLREACSAGELTPEDMDRKTARAQGILQQMSTTIDGFRTFFQPDQSPGRFSLRHQVEEAVGMVEGAFAHAGIQLTLEPGDDATLYGYGNECGQVVLHLLDNAKEAIQRQGRSDGVVTLTLRRTDGTVRLTVTDNGGGIPEEVLPRVFDPYFTTKRMGTGLGLYICRTLVEKGLNGQMTVRNTGDGAEFTLILPIPPEL